MSLLSLSISVVISLTVTIFVSSVYAEVYVQVNLNRPLHDVNEKFVSFTVEPADLYRALDGPNRKTLTNMATILGSSYIKFLSDYNFIPDADMKYRNPTKSIWKGFNRWTSAVNWTMIVPMPHTAGTWNPMESLRILNSSYIMGLTDCIWQLGTELAPNVPEYFNDLNTLNVMVDSFNPYVDDWEVTGAEIPSATSSEEVRRYIDASKNINAAYNWLQPADSFNTNAMISSGYENDRILRIMFTENVPVWLNFSPKERVKKLKQRSNMDDIADALRWAQTLGESASTGFDAVFRRLDKDDLEYPSQSFFVSMLFKNVMGSRVFPARPFTTFLRSNKLYTHCANTFSGGIAYMIVNPDDDVKQVTIRSTTQIPDGEYWQYILTFKKSYTYLNNEKLTINPTLAPQVKTMSPNQALQLNLPGRSVGFWVLPTAEVEHCQFTEIHVDDIERESMEEININKHVSSSNKLLQQLIQETALAHSALTNSNLRRRRFTTFSSRPRHFVLEDKGEHTQTLAKLFEPLSLEKKSPKKREEELENRQLATLKWIKELLDTAMQDRGDLFSPKRNTRSTDDYLSAIFGTIGDKKKSTVVKKITEIRKPAKKSIKSVYDPEHFDEEEFFKKIGAVGEPEAPLVPEGDVHLRHIANVEGEDIVNSDEQSEKRSEDVNMESKTGKEARNEIKPLHLLPTEFYEALPISSMDKIKSNALLFSKQNTGSNVEKISSAQLQSGGQLAEDFLHAQEEFHRSFLHQREEEEKKMQQQKSNKTEQSEMSEDSDDEILEKIKTLRAKYIDYLAENLENYLNERDEQGHGSDQKSLEHSAVRTTDTTPWWQLSSLRKRRSPRALRNQFSEDSGLSNMIANDEDLLPLGSVSPKQVVAISPQIPRRFLLDEDKRNNESNDYLRTVKDKVDRMVGIVARQVNEWYNGPITNHVDGVKVAMNKNRVRVGKGKRI